MARSDDLTCKTDAPKGNKPNDILFGSDTPNEAIRFLQQDEAIRISVFSLPDGESISVFEVDKSNGLECADTGTGAEFPYDPCCDGYGKEYTKTGSYYIKGSGAFKFVYSGVTGTASVKFSIVKNSSVTEKMACPECKGFSPTETIKSGCGCSEKLFGFLDSEPKPSDADIEVQGCDGAVLFWASSTGGYGKYPVIGCDGLVRFYLWTRSDTAIEESSCSDCNSQECYDFTWRRTGKEFQNGENIEREEISNCGNTRLVYDREVTWLDTNITRCYEHMTQVQQVNDFGRFRWKNTSVVCGYSPSETVMYGCDCKESLYGYLPNEPRPNDADFAVTDCNNNIIFYGSSTNSVGKYPVTDCNNTVIFYLWTKSETAVDSSCSGC
jgi:hypothetical protein